MEVRVRAAEAEEAGRLVPLYEWLFAPPGSRPAAWDERRAEVALRSAIESHDAVVLVAETTANVPPASSASPPGAAGSAQILGICTAYLDLHSVRFGYRAWVEDLAVDPESRSRGIGRALLAAAMDWARERGATHLELDSADARADAHRFYEREGAAYRSVCFGWEL